MAFDFDFVREQARGRWIDILTALAPELSDAASTVGSTKHHECPVHGGQNGDAFRFFPDAQENGGATCNSCGQLSNGFAVLCWVRDCSFSDSINLVGEHLKLDPKARQSAGAGTTKRKSKKSSQSRPPHHPQNDRGLTEEEDRALQSIQLNRAKLSRRWQDAFPDNGRIEAYLRHRGLSGTVPPSLRFCQCLPYYDVDPANPKGPLLHVGTFPAILAQVCSQSSGLVSIHRTYLDGNGSAGKASVPSPKKLCQPIYPSACSGAAIKIFPAGEVLAVTEGIETALAVHEATHVPVWSAVSAHGLATFEPPSIVKRLEVWADSGEAGESAAKQLADRATGYGLEVVVITPNAPHGDWLDVLIAEGPAVLRQAVSAAKPAERVETVPEIQIHEKEHLVTAEAVKSLAADPVVFQRGSILVHVLRDKSATPTISKLPKPVLRLRMTAAANWTKYKSSEDDWMPAHPPEWAVDQCHTLGNWDGIRRLEGVTEIPLIRADGSILSTPGYDEATGLLYEPQQDFAAVPPNPTHADAVAALAQLLDVVVDFPFATPAHQSAWVASLLTPLARHAFTGPSPLFLADANVAGAGKTLLCDLVGLLIYGRSLPRMSYSHDDVEMQKIITSIAIAGDPIILIDNIASSFGGPSLDAVLTSTIWKGRSLGKSEAPTYPLKTTWYASGNNITFNGDIARRVLHVRLNSPEENPEERQSFRHPDIQRWVVSERCRLIPAALTILRAFILAGRPSQSLKPWGSFDGWSDLIRNAIVWIGMPDPGTTRTDLKSQSDTKMEALRQLIAGWEALDPQRKGFTVSEMLKEIKKPVSEWQEDSMEPLREAIEELYPGKGPPSSKSLGKIFVSLRDRVVGNKRLRMFKNRDHTSVWYVDEVSTAGYECYEGSVSEVTGKTECMYTDIHMLHIRGRGGVADPAKHANPAEENLNPAETPSIYSEEI